MLTPLLVALGAGCGGLLRVVLTTKWPQGASAGTVVANTVGSFVIGIAAGRDLGSAGWALIAIGFCGALTTWSTMAVQIVDAGWQRGALLALATLGLAVGAVSLGFALA